MGLPHQWARGPMIAGHGHASLRPQATGATQKPRRTPAGDDGSRRMEFHGQDSGGGRVARGRHRDVLLLKHSNPSAIGDDRCGPTLRPQATTVCDAWASDPLNGVHRQDTGGGRENHQYHHLRRRLRRRHHRRPPHPAASRLRPRPRRRCCRHHHGHCRCSRCCHFIAPGQ